MKVSFTGKKVLNFKESITFESKYCISKRTCCCINPFVPNARFLYHPDVFRM